MTGMTGMTNDVRWALAGWVLFLSAYAIMWDSSISRMLQMAEPRAAAADSRAPVERTFLFVAGIYATVRTTLLIVMWSLLLFCLVRFAECVLPEVTGPPRIVAVAKWLMEIDRGALFSAAKPEYLPFHAAVMCSSIAIATVYATVYATRKDLSTTDGARSVVAREAIAMPAIGGVAYIGFALVSALGASRQA